MKLRFFLTNLLSLLLFFASIDAFVQGDLIYKANVNPGDHLVVKIPLTNSSKEPMEVNCELSDYSFNAEGQYFFSTPGTVSRSNASWIKLYTDKCIIPANNDSHIFYDIDVPNDPTLKGTYWSVLLIEPTSTPNPVDPTKTEGFVINVKARYAYLIITNIGETRPTLKIIKKEIVTENQSNFLLVDVHNTGDAYLYPKLVLDAFDTKGKFLQKFESFPQVSLPDTSVRYRLDLKGLDQKKAMGFVLLDSGDQNLFGERFELELP